MTTQESPDGRANRLIGRNARRMDAKSGESGFDRDRRICKGNRVHNGRWSYAECRRRSNSHVSLKTARSQEMIDFYATLVGDEAIHRDGVGAGLTNDSANNRIALLSSPVLSGDADREQ